MMQGMGASWRVGVDRRESTALVTAALGLTLMAPNVIAIAALVVLGAAVRAMGTAATQHTIRLKIGPAGIDPASSHSGQTLSQGSCGVKFEPGTADRVTTVVLTGGSVGANVDHDRLRHGTKTGRDPPLCSL